MHHNRRRGIKTRFNFAVSWKLKVDKRRDEFGSYKAAQGKFTRVLFLLSNCLNYLLRSKVIKLQVNCLQCH